MPSTPRILYYCQSLVGIGHLTASLHIVRELLADGEVDLIHGGLDSGALPAHPRFRELRLPTLLHDEDSGDFHAPDGGNDIAAVWAARREAIGAFLQPPYRAIVVEFYPFGRRRFKDEILSMFRTVKATSGDVPVFTSVREVLVPRPVENERRMVESVRKHIHTVFVRSDAEIIHLRETFSLAHEIEDRLVHTGYLAPAWPAERPPRQPQVLISQGGGNVGRELLEAGIAVAPRMPGFTFLLAAGTRTPPDELEALRRTVRSGNVRIVPFLADFREQLMVSAVSISLGGDNTLLDVLGARTPALAYPYQANPEQGIRIRKFAEKGLLHELTPADLAPERLQAKIELALSAPYPARLPAMDGARVTADHIRAVLAGLPA